MSLLQKSPIKRLFSAKETYNFQEPTNRSYPIVFVEGLINRRVCDILIPLPVDGIEIDDSLNFVMSL